jgi:hypothetical protein
VDSNINRISLNLSDEDRLAIEAAIQVLRDKLQPHLIALVPEDRSSLPKMGDKTVAFVRKAAHYARADAARPAYLDVEEMERDLGAVDILSTLHRPLAQIVANLDDSVMAAGAEAYSAALAYYHSIKGAARARVPGAQAIADDLSQRFANRMSNGKTPVPAAA